MYTDAMRHMINVYRVPTQTIMSANRASLLITGKKEKKRVKFMLRKRTKPRIFFTRFQGEHLGS